MGLHEDTQNNLVTTTVELAGLTKENSQVDADVIIHQLTISGKHNASGQTEDKEKKVTVRERWHGKLSCSLHFHMKGGLYYFLLCKSSMVTDVVSA
jgi:HSP20 family molecular chaperone IbpA